MDRQKNIPPKQTGLQNLNQFNGVFRYSNQGYPYQVVSMQQGVYVPQNQQFSFQNQPQQFANGGNQGYQRAIQMGQQEPQLPNLSSEGFCRLLQSKYIMGAEIGKGSFAKVFEGIDSESDERVAIKKIDKKKFEESYLEMIDGEIQVLSALNNEHIIRFMDLFNEGDYIYIVTELCELGDLEVFVRKHFSITQRQLPEKLVKAFIYQILLAFLGIADMKIIHRDMKLSNVLITRDLRIKVADFGLAKSSHNNDRDQVGTPMTMAPEVLNNQYYDSTCDVWSVGTMLYELLEGRPPFLPSPNGGIQELKRLISQHNIVFRNRSISPEAQDLVNRMLTLDPSRRITWHKMFEHSWFQECLTNGESFIQQVSKDYKQFIDCQEKQLDPQFAQIFGFELHQFVSFHVNQISLAIHQAQQKLRELASNNKNFQKIDECVNSLGLLLIRFAFHSFTFEYNKKRIPLSLPRELKENILFTQHPSPQLFTQIQSKTLSYLAEKAGEQIFTICEIIITEDFEMFKCNFAPIVNLLDMLYNPHKGFIAEVILDYNSLTPKEKDRLFLINVQKAYAEVPQPSNNINKQSPSKAITFKKNIVPTNLHIKKEQVLEQIHLFQEIVLGYQLGLQSLSEISNRS